MALPTGLLPVLVFVLTVGISVPVTLGSQLFYRSDDGSFVGGLRAALLEAAALYLVGTVVIWSFAGDVWTVPATLLLVGALALVGFAGLPLLVGQQLLRYTHDVDDGTALRLATYGWPVAMVAVFGAFIAPGGVDGGTLLSLGGPRACFGGFCGISVPFAAAVVLELVVAVVGPGVVGVVLHATAE